MEKRRVVCGMDFVYDKNWNPKVMTKEQANRLGNRMKKNNNDIFETVVCEGTHKSEKVWRIHFASQKENFSIYA